MRVTRLKAVLVLLVLVAVGGADAQAARGKKKAPKVGDVAPLFKLPQIHGAAAIDLNDIVGSRPIVLFFGSYT
jgi:hypothetical protein